MVLTTSQRLINLLNIDWIQVCKKGHLNTATRNNDYGKVGGGGGGGGGNQTHLLLR